MDISLYDATINNAMFLTKVDNIIVMLYSAIMKRDMNIVKHKISDNIYNEYLAKVNESINNHEIQMYGEFNVKTSSIKNIILDENFIIVDVDITLRYLDYIIDDETKKVKSGVTDRREEHNYTLTFIKRKDAKTLEPSRHCPTCGSVCDISRTGECEYCGSIFNTLDYDYVLSKIN